MKSASLKMEKFAVRQDMKRRRDAMSLDEVINFSRIIEDKLFSYQEFLACENVMFYLSFGNEVRTDEIISRSLKDLKRVYVPRLVKRERRLEICEIKDLDHQEFVLGSYGIREPSRLNSRLVSLAKIDAVIAPGLAFDRSGKRIGFGGGYFDWLLKQLPDDALRIGVAFGVQLMESIPEDPWDERVQIIITENGTVNC